MTTTPALHLRTVVLISLLLFETVCLHAAETRKAESAQILKMPGIRKGLCLHIGCGDGSLTAALSGGGANVVHGLALDRAELHKARTYVRSRGLYGRVAVDTSSLHPLPYADGIANVIVVDDYPALRKKGLVLSEIVRVLAPRGVAFLGDAGDSVRKELAGAARGFSTGKLQRWTRIVKPQSAETDDWPQYRHDSSRAAISRDGLVGPPTSVRWLAGRRWVLSGAGTQCGLFSAGGRVFYLNAEGKKAVWIQARDGFNGIPLWKRRLDVPPRDLPFAASSDRIYTLLKKNGNVVALDAATGKTVMEYGFSAQTITLNKNRMYLGVGKIRAVDIETGKEIWRGPHGGYKHCVIADGKLFQKVYGQKELSCLDLETGKLIWKVPNEDKADLRCYRDGMLFTRARKREEAHEGEGEEKGHRHPLRINHAYRAEDGKHLWSHTYRVHWHQGRADVFLLGGLVWLQDSSEPQAWVGLDPATGKEKRRVPLKFQRGFLRCYPDLATEKYILEGAAMGFFDFARGKFSTFYGARGTCGSGFRPANGLLYKSPNICVCFAIVRGIGALASGPMPDVKKLTADAGEPLEKGPAFGRASGGAPSRAGEWPTFRHDELRGGGTRQAVPTQLRTLWEAKIGSVVSSPVIAGGKVFAAAVDEHCVVALDAARGMPAWSYTAGARVDTPPTIYKGMALFGSADGYAYCLRARDGKLAWRLRVAPADRRIVVREQLESLWPLHGAVLVKDGVAYLAAGRHTELDGGIQVCAVKPGTGKILWRRQVIRSDLLQQRHHGTLVNATGGILTADGESIYMDRIILDVKSGEERDRPTGHYLYGGACGFEYDIARPPYGWKHDWRRWFYSKDAVRGKKCGEGPAIGAAISVRDDMVVSMMNGTRQIVAFTIDRGGRMNKAWSVKTGKDIRMKAVLLAGEEVFLALRPEEGDAPRGEIRIYAAADGREIGRVGLKGAPKHDGLAAAGGRLYVATQDGRILCLGK